MHLSGKHGASGNKDGRYINTGCRHKESRYIFVTVRNHDQCIKLMCLCHTLCGIGNQVSCNKRILHTDMTHGNSVTDRNRRKFHRKTACFGNTHLHRLADFIQINMPRNNFVIGAHHPDHRLLHLFLCVAQGIK